MKTITYSAFAYRQGTSSEAPLIVSFVAPAEEVIDWAGMPRRSNDSEMAGFQRAYDEGRVEKAKAFFKNPKNQSPTAIVVGLHPPTSGGHVGAKLVFAPNSEHRSVRACTLTITYPETSDDATTLVRALINRRLSLQSGPETVATDEGSEDEDGESDDGELDDSENDDGEIELGRSLLMRLNDRLGDTKWCNDNSDALLDLAKPATVLDGQHRLKGAERCERGIPFAVCGLFDCSWAEQVFQFTVINYTQHGIEDQFITNNAALSLTQVELTELQSRLVQAGVKVVEYELMKVIHFHNDSPFKDLVNLTEKRDNTKIGYKTMVRVSRAWYDARHPVFKIILPALYPDLPDKRHQKERLLRWRKEDWGIFFLDFWRVVHTAFAIEESHSKGHRLWDVGHSQLMVAIVLFEFQSAFLDALNQQDEDYFRIAGDNVDLQAEMRQRIQKRSRKFVEWFEPAFFSNQWGHKSLSVGPGRKALAECFFQLVRSKGTYRYQNSALFSASGI